MGRRSPKGRKSGGSPNFVASPPKLSPSAFQSLANSLKKKRPHMTPPNTENNKKSKNTNSPLSDKPDNLPAQIQSLNRQLNVSGTISPDESADQTTPHTSTPNSAKPTTINHTPQEDIKSPPPQNENTPPVKNRSPPPFMMAVDQWQLTARKVLSGCPDGTFTAKLVNNQIKITTDSINTYRQIQTILQDNKIAYHTHSLPEERTLKVLLRGIPSAFDEQFVKDELSSFGYTITHVRQFLKNGRRLPMYMVTLPNNHSSKRIFNMQSIFGISIRVEPYKTSGAAQCFSCQGFGHSSNHCQHAARCVKCGGSHLTKECKKLAETPPKCCNCGGEHTANYRRCPAYVAEMDRLAKSRRIPDAVQPPKTTSPPASSQPQSEPEVLSYANVTSKGTQPKVDPQSKSKNELVKILTDTITSLAESDDLKNTIMKALNAMLLVISNV
jgi:hypothetical protein